MNTTKEKKEERQNLIKIKIESLKSIIFNLVKVQGEHSTKLQQLNTQGQKTYSAEYLTEESKKLKSSFASEKSEIYKGIEKKLKELQTLIQERNAELDLTNPALTNALLLIQSAGEKLSFEQAVKINQNFKYDQSLLGVIFAAYGNRDKGDISKMIYNIDSLIDTMKQSAYVVTQNVSNVSYEASAGGLVSSLFKLATFEGVSIDESQRNEMSKSLFHEGVMKGLGLR